MSEIPKIVRRRLAGGVSAGPHPDADQLTALVEQSLTEPERKPLLTHLSQCADCREIVFLSSPQNDAAIATSAVRSTWLGWPALRWGAAVACAVIVVAAVSLRPRWEPHTVSDRGAQIAARIQEPAQPQTAPAPNSKKDEIALDERSAPARRDRNLADQANKDGARTEKTSRVAVAPMEESKLRFAPAAPVVAENKPSSGDLGVSANAAAPFPSEQTEVSSGNMVAGGKGLATLGKAKEADAVSAVQSAKAKREMPAAAATGLAQSLYKRVIPRWTLGADGTLQRSLDAGQTWKIIPVAPDATFTAVAAMATDIWVGGSHGSLYHSADAGEHWMQVVPVSEGHSLTDNIIGIEFPDSLHGKITTAGQESWTTADGGQSWEITK